jgi:hypothetical protein
MHKLVLEVSLVVLVASILLGRFWFGELDRFHAGYERIQVGMTLAEVEAILGPGTEIDLSEVPTTLVSLNPAAERAAYERARRTGRPLPTVRSFPAHSKPVVQGDRVVRWRGDHNGARILIGFKDGKVAEKWYTEYSL